MDKLLTILITHHNEPVEIGEPLFQSIDTQIGGVFDKIKIILSNNDSQQISMPNFPISKYKNVQNCVSTIKSTSQNTLSSHLNYLISKVDTPYFCSNSSNILYIFCPPFTKNAILQKTLAKCVDS